MHGYWYDEIYFLTLCSCVHTHMQLQLPRHHLRQPRHHRRLQGGGGGGVVCVGGWGGVGVEWWVKKEREEGGRYCHDEVLFLTAWCPFYCCLKLLCGPPSGLQAWSGMRMLLDRLGHDNQPRWASHYLHFPWVDSHTRVSSFHVIIPRYSQLNNNDVLDCVRPYHNVWLFMSMRDMGSEKLLLDELPSSSPLRLQGTFALVVL